MRKMIWGYLIVDRPGCKKKWGKDTCEMLQSEAVMEAATGAYVTFRMTLSGHTGLLPHQFYCCPRGHHSTQSFCLVLCFPHQPLLVRPGLWRHGSTWPNTQAGSDWPMKASNTPQASQPVRLCLDTERLH